MRPPTLRRRLLSASATALVTMFALASCSTPTAPTQEPAPQPVETTPVPESEQEPEPALTAEMIAAWTTNQPWQFSPDGLGEPVTIPIIDGAANDDLGRTYEIGEAIESDANGDGVPDVAVSITEFDGNSMQQLWYIWLGIEGAVEGDVLAEQMMYPIARMSRCGDAVHEVAPTETGFSITETLRHPLDPGDCATGGTWHQTREIIVDEFSGEPFPILTSPVSAWGGVCPVPRLDWLDGETMTGIEVRSAPHPDARVIVHEDETGAVFGVGEAPLMTATGASFFAFMPPEYLEHTSQDIEKVPVRVHCAFSDGA